jgi:hypothetical protein
MIFSKFRTKKPILFSENGLLSLHVLLRISSVDSFVVVVNVGKVMKSKTLLTPYVRPLITEK